MKNQIKSGEIVILVLVSLMSFVANLPDQLVGNLVDKKLLLFVLTASVVIALFRHLRLMLFLAIVILAVGANLPQEFALSMGFSPMIMLAALGFLVAISLLNYALKVLPTGETSSEALDTRLELLGAISKGDQATVFELMNRNVDINFTVNGQSPLHLAVARGYPDIVRMLVNGGANIEAQDAEGKTPIDIALEKRFIRSSEILFKAAKPYAAEERAA